MVWAENATELPRLGSQRMKVNVYETRLVTMKVKKCLLHAPFRKAKPYQWWNESGNAIDLMKELGARDEEPAKDHRDIDHHDDTNWVQV